MPSLAGRLVNLGLLILLFGLAGHYALGELSVLGAAFDTIKRDEVAPERTVATADPDTDNAEVGDAGPTAVYVGADNASGTPGAADAVPAPHHGQGGDQGLAGPVQSFVQQHLRAGQDAAPASINPDSTISFPLSALVCRKADALAQAVSAMESHQKQALDDLLISRNPGQGQCYLAPPGKHYHVVQVSQSERYPSIAILNITAASDASAEPLWSLNIGAALVQH